MHSIDFKILLYSLPHLSIITLILKIRIHQESERFNDFPRITQPGLAELKALSLIIWFQASILSCLLTTAGRASNLSDLWEGDGSMCHGLWARDQWHHLSHSTLANRNTLVFLTKMKRRKVEHNYIDDVTNVTIYVCTWHVDRSGKGPFNQSLPLPVSLWSLKQCCLVFW